MSDAASRTYWPELTGIVHVLYWGPGDRGYGWNLSCTSMRIPSKEHGISADLVPTCLVCVHLWENP